MTEEHEAGTELTRAALERATEGVEPQTAPLLDAVPAMLAEALARRRAQAENDALVSACRRAIPRLAATAALLVVVSTALLLIDGPSGTGAAKATWDEVLVAGDDVSDELLLGSMLDAEGDR